MIETFAALAEPTRFRIVELLGTGAFTVNEICEHLALSQPQASKHLRVLRDVALVDVEPRAQQRLYTLSASSFRQLHDWLESYRQVWDRRFDALDKLLIELDVQKEQADE